MMEFSEKVIKVGFNRSPTKIFDGIELTCADMIRQGWRLKDTLVEEGLGNIHLFFEKERTRNHGETVYGNERKEE